MLLCEGLAEKMDLPISGKHNPFGSLFGPVNDANVNGIHPALLASLRCNSDVQLPYRFPITEQTHCSHHCDEEHCVTENTRWMARETARRQAAQAGYACDYQNKRPPLALNEIKQWQQGQQQLEKELEGMPAGYAGARIGKRLMSDCYARGVVRGSVETCNLLINSEKCIRNPESAECLRTSPIVEITLSHGIMLMNAVCFGKDPPEERTRVHTRTRNLYQGAPRTVMPVVDIVWSPGLQPQSCTIEPLRVCHALRICTGGPKYHRLTAKGKKKIDKHKAESAANNEKPSGEQTAIEPPELSPGADYEIKSEGGTNWVAIPAHAATEKYRHDWVIKARARPHTPVVMGAVKPASEEEHKQRLLLLFASWTLNRDHATLNETAWQSNLESCPEVRHLSDLRLPEPTSWELCFMHWYFQFQGVATEKLLRIVRSFAFAYCLPRENGGLRADDLSMATTKICRMWTLILMKMSWLWQEDSRQGRQDSCRG